MKLKTWKQVTQRHTSAFYMGSDSVDTDMLRMTLNFESYNVTKVLIKRPNIVFVSTIKPASR